LKLSSIYRHKLLNVSTSSNRQTTDPE
jgi:hypothetical protein